VAVRVDVYLQRACTDIRERSIFGLLDQTLLTDQHKISLTNGLIV